MRDVVGAAADAAAAPGVHNIQDQRRVDTDGRVQATRGLPGAITDTGHIFTVGAGRMKREGYTGDADDVPGVGQAASLHLQTFQAGVHAARGASGTLLFAEDVPGFQGLADLEMEIIYLEIAQLREAEFEVGVRTS